MKKLDLLLSIFLIFVANSQYVQAQDKVTVKGTVSSAESGELLYGAYVLCGTGGGSATDENGFYSVSATPANDLSSSTSVAAQPNLSFLKDRAKSFTM